MQLHLQRAAANFVGSGLDVSMSTRRCLVSSRRRISLAQEEEEPLPRQRPHGIVCKACRKRHLEMPRQPHSRPRNSSRRGRRATKVHRDLVSRVLAKFAMRPTHVVSSSRRLSDKAVHVKSTDPKGRKSIAVTVEWIAICHASSRSLTRALR